MNPRYEDEDGLDLDATVRGLRAIGGSREGDHNRDWGLRVNRSLEKAASEIQALREWKAKVEGAALDRVEIAKIAKAEQAALEKKVETLDRMVWGLVGALAVAIIGIAVTRVFK